MGENVRHMVNQYTCVLLLHVDVGCYSFDVSPCIKYVQYKRGCAAFVRHIVSISEDVQC